METEKFTGKPWGGKIDCTHAWEFTTTGYDIGVDNNGHAYEEHQEVFVCTVCGAERIDSTFNTWDNSHLNSEV